MVSTDFGSVVDDSKTDAVVIATPVSTHFDLARRSLEAGKHTFIEKPMAASVEECRSLVELAENKGLVLMVGHTYVYSPAVHAMKRIIDSGEIGEVMYISARRLNLGLFQNDINAAWDLAPHDISIVLYLLGKEPSSVNCLGKAHLNPAIEDVTNMSLSFDNGSFAMVHSSWIDPKKIREVIVVGSKKMIIFDDAEPLEKVRIYDKHVDAPPHYDTYAEFQFSYHYGGMQAPFVQPAEPLKAECEQFLRSIETGELSPSNGVEGMKVVRVLEAASRSLKVQGASVPLEPLAAAFAR
jgi:predicted dehydrogenase